MSSKPCSRSSVTMCSIIGALAIGIIGFGALDVSGRRRVPSPPAMMTAFMPPTVPADRAAQADTPGERSARPSARACRASGT